MTTPKLQAGDRFPSLEVAGADGVRDLSKPIDGTWMMVVVYRGRHCPMCTKYLNQLEPFIGDLKDIGVDVAAVSGDSAEQLAQHRVKLVV